MYVCMYVNMYVCMLSIYTHELLELFRVTPGQVAAKVGNSFLPTRHLNLVTQPDLYGPLVAAFILPQVILLMMMTSDVSIYI